LRLREFSGECGLWGWGEEGMSQGENPGRKRNILSENEMQMGVKDKM